MKKRRGKLISVVIKLNRLTTHKELKIYAAKRGLTLSHACANIISNALAEEGKQ